MRAVGLSRGDLTGARMADPPVSGQNDLQRAFVARSIRQVDLPPELAPRAGWSCDAYQPEVTAACTRAPGAEAPAERYRTGVTNFGTYPPLGYAPAAAGMLLAGDPLSALYLGRLAQAALCLALLALALVLLWDGGAGALSLAGVSVAVTPMVLFVATQLSPSSLEICAAIGLNAALLRLARGAVRAQEAAAAGKGTGAPDPGGGAAAAGRGADTRGPYGTTTVGGQGVWLAAAVCALLLAVSRPLGPAWVTLASFLWVAWSGPGAALAAFRAGGWAARVALLAAALGSLGTLVWLALVGAGPGGGSAGLAGIPQALASIPETLAEAIGVFGALDTVLPKPVYLLWGAALVGAFAVPVFLAGDRGRRQMDLVLVLTGLATLSVAVFVSLPTGFAPQGRHILPALVALPLYGAEVLVVSARARPGGRLDLAASSVIAAATLVQLAALWANARRHAIGASGDWLLWSHAAWSPPLGWAPWTAIALLAAGLGLACARNARSVR